MRTPSPRSLGFSLPAEWQLHDACWLAWPSHEELWQDNLAPAREAWVQLVTALAAPDPRSGALRGEVPHVLVPDGAQEALCREALRGLRARYYTVPFGDIWLRDTAPIFLRDARGVVRPARFRFNGWGGKYVLEHDDAVSERISERSGCGEGFACEWVLEGGSVEPDGEGTILTSRQCLLNPNRNPELSQEAVEARLREDLGAEKILWVTDGLLNDHTDGHIDTIARFVAPGEVVCMKARDAQDPNAEVLEAIARELAAQTDARGRALKVHRVPSPGLVQDDEGRVMPASYVNFYLSNTAVVVPTYGSPHDEEAVRALGALFPGRRAVGVSAKAILSGGGAFHCITQQVPAEGGAR